MNPKYGDVYKWASTEFKVMYVGPGVRVEGWTGYVLTTDQGDPSNRDMGMDWVNAGVTEPRGHAEIENETGWEKVE